MSKNKPPHPRAYARGIVVDCALRLFTHPSSCLRAEHCGCGGKLAIIYKLLNDLLLLALVFFAMALVADGMIPGIVTDHISFLKMTLFIALNLSAIYFAGIFSGVAIEKRDTNKKTAVLLGFFAAILIGNSLFKLNVILAIFILVFTLIAGYFVYKNILES